VLPAPLPHVGFWPPLRHGGPNLSVRSPATSIPRTANLGSTTGNLLYVFVVLNLLYRCIHGAAVGARNRAALIYLLCVPNLNDDINNPDRCSTTVDCTYPAPRYPCLASPFNPAAVTVPASPATLLLFAKLSEK
jgi:hypothetical protein